MTPYKDPERRREYMREYYRKNPDKYRRYRENNREQIAVRNKEYREDPKNRPALRAAGRRYSKTEKGRARNARAMSKYIKSDKARLRWQRWNARKQVNGGNVSPEEWDTVLEMYTDHRGTMCAYCYEIIEKPTMDHIEPISRGGRHEIENVVPACKSCNSSKGAKPLLRWMYDKQIVAVA